MADTENHDVAIMGGMWGGTSKHKLPFSIKDKGLQNSHHTQAKGGDQHFLEKVVWPEWQKSGLVFISLSCSAKVCWWCKLFYNCVIRLPSFRNFMKHLTWHHCWAPWRRPFPFRLDQQTNFVASMWSHEMPWKIPAKKDWTWPSIPQDCRPVNHSDWVHG